jgi:polyisoprenyl-phosphate glycosyltransferase
VNGDTYIACIILLFLLFLWSLLSCMLEKRYVVHATDYQIYIYLHIMKFISIVTPCFNEQDNIVEVYNQIRQYFLNNAKYTYEHIVIDNCSTDNTITILKNLALNDSKLKVIINARNFGPVRSPYHGLLQSTGDAVILMSSDLQDPPKMIPDLIQKWEEGFPIAVGVKVDSDESWAMYQLRTIYYKTLQTCSDINLIEHFTGFGIYDRRVIQILRSLNEPYPYLRGLVADIGLPVVKLPFKQPLRKKGKSKSNILTFYEFAMLGITSYTKIPLRLATLIGFTTAMMSVLVGAFYLVYKLIFWNQFSLGLAPLIVGIFFFGAVQLFFLGIIGEYIGSIYTQVLRRPLVIEKERINF